MSILSGKKVTFGALERVDLPQFKIKDILAKVDTGAYTGALHCETIQLTRDENNRAVLRFRPISKRHALQQVSDFKQIEVTSASGHTAKRYIIPVKLKIQGKIYEGRIGLTSRKDLRRQMLIGRRFLRENNILVDVTKNQERNDKREQL